MLQLSEEVLKAIEVALKRGNTVELKKVNGQIQVIEISRKLQVKDRL